MNETTTAPTLGAPFVRNVQEPSHSHPHHSTSPASTDLRMLELEIENSRLQRLVAELLLKNQQLRKEQGE